MKGAFSLLLLSIVFAGFSQNYMPKANGEIVEHTYYTLSYSEDHEQPEWVYYGLNPSRLSNSTIKRTNKFISDPNVSTGSASHGDYTNCGYDRGHLCPVASMSFNDTAMKEVFYMSNISPQYASFNRGVWKRLEELVREWGTETPELHVIAGPILSSCKSSIEVNNGDKIGIPGHFYKIVYSPSKDEMIGFIIPNLPYNQTNSLNEFTAKVDSIELLTGIDFFASIDLSEQESCVDLSKWDFGELDKNIRSISTSAKVSESVQCRGVSKSTGAQCKNLTRNKSGYCHFHQK